MVRTSLPSRIWRSRLLLWETSGGESDVEPSRRESEAARFSCRPPESKMVWKQQQTQDHARAVQPPVRTLGQHRATPIPRQLASATPSALSRSLQTVAARIETSAASDTPWEANCGPADTRADTFGRFAPVDATFLSGRSTGNFGYTAGTPRRPIDGAQITAGRQTVDGPEMRFVFVYFWFEYFSSRD